MSDRRLVALAAVVVLATACATTTTTAGGVTPRTTFGSGDDKAHAAIFHCGLERWAVKTGTDPGAGQVDTSGVVDATVADLGRLPVPPGMEQAGDQRAAPAETTVYRVHATLTGYKQESDSDYHLVLTDGSDSMIAEIPDPACVGAGSPFLVAITAARAAFDAKYRPSDFFQHADVPVTVTGVGFFDRIHGQTGVAPNGIELHPVLSISFGS